MTDAEKLEVIKQYVIDMSPIFRPAILLPPDQMQYNKGWDDAMYETQRELMNLLDDT